MIAGCYRVLVVCLLIAASALTGCAGRAALDMDATDARMAKGVELPVDTPVAFYVAPVHLDSRFYVNTYNLWITPGEALKSAIDTVAEAYVEEHSWVDPLDPGIDEYGLLAVFMPDWDFENGQVHLTIEYRIHDAAGNELESGSVTKARPLGELASSAGFYNSALKAAQVTMVNTINGIHGSGQVVAARGKVRDIDSDLLVNLEDPIRTGTGFFVSNGGQLLTAAHVTNKCLRVHIEHEGTEHPVDVLGTSKLLDVALLQSPVQSESYLSLRAEPKIVLGEKVAAAGFPMQDVLAKGANLTIGNVSSLKALPGSLGMFQFSAPVQPGSSGGPVITEHGELIGMTTGTLNVGAMIEKGVLPQNVNFALEGQYLAKFTERHSTNIRSFELRQMPADVAGVNEYLISTLAHVSCYQ